MTNLKKAIKTSYDHLILDTNPDLLPFAPEGGEYDVNLYIKSSANRFKETEMMMVSS